MAASAPEALRGELRIPASEASFANKEVEIRLFSRDPSVMDKAADLVGSLNIASFSHQAGKATARPFSLPLNRAYDANRSYYATFYIVDKGARTHIGNCEHAPAGSCTVFSADGPGALTVNFRALR